MADILVIKLSALGDFIMASGCFKAIRRRHAGDRVVLLTTAPYAALGRACPYFDEVVVDARPRPWQVAAWLRLMLNLRRHRFARVYDLQRKQRTATLYRALKFGRRDLEWSGVVAGCSHYVPDLVAENSHIVDKLAGQLRAAGMAEVPPLDVSWLGGGEMAASVADPFALLTVGTAPSRPEKLAPPALYGAVARSLVGQGITPVLVGTAADAAIIDAVVAECPQALNLCGRTDFADLADLGRRAVVAVGNDTGPMHLFSATGCPVVVLFSNGSDPDRVQPRGPVVEVLRRANLAELPATEAEAAIARIRRKAPARERAQ